MTTYSLPAYGEFFKSATLGENNKYSKKAICSAIRNDIKSAKKAGLLPKNLKATVKKIDHNSIYITVDLPGHNFNPAFLLACTFQLHSDARPPRRPRELENVFGTLRVIANGYNYDSSDSMVDYFNTNFYVTTQTNWQKVKVEEEAWLVANAELVKDLAITAKANPSELDTIIAKMSNAGQE